MSWTTDLCTISDVYHTINSACNDSVLIMWSSDYNLVSHVALPKMKECVSCQHE